MPFVPVEEAWNLSIASLADATDAAAAAIDGRVALIGLPEARCVLLHWGPGHVTAFHRHPRAVEVFLVLEGELRGWLEHATGTNVVSARAGSLMCSPAGMAHRFEVIGDRPVVLLALVAPNEDAPDETTE
jgi:quercetin dioxygenase-like cupin family protein